MSNISILFSELSTLQQLADEYVDRGPYSVTDKKQLPVGCESNDYVSGRLYWWKENGVYVRKDGIANPEVNSPNFDRSRLSHFIDSIVLFTLIDSLTKKNTYKEKVDQFLAVWFINPKTRMNPHLEYAQIVPGQVSNGIGIIDTYDFYYMLHALEYRKNRTAIDLAIYNGVKRWFKQYTTWLFQSPQAKQEAGRKNNHGSSFDVQTIRYLSFLRKSFRAKYLLHRTKKKRLNRQVDENGIQPLEKDRSISLYYHIYNLTMLLHLCEAGLKININLINYKNKIKKACDFALPYLSTQDQWIFEQITEVSTKDILEPLFLANTLLGKNYCSDILSANEKAYQLFHIDPLIRPTPSLVGQLQTSFQ
jgi:hypothetical protein